MATVTVLNAKCIKVEMHNTALEAETYWISLNGVYLNTKTAILDVDVSRKNGGSARLNSNVHSTRIGRVCSAARKELQAYVSEFLAHQPQAGFDLRKA